MNGNQTKTDINYTKAALSQRLSPFIKVSCFVVCTWFIRVGMSPKCHLRVSPKTKLCDMTKKNYDFEPVQIRAKEIKDDSFIVRGKQECENSRT